MPLLNVPDLLRTAVATAGGPPAGPAPSASGLRARRILLVEDSITARTLLSNILQAAGYAVHTAVDGNDAWASLGTANFDLVVSDVEMPRMDGFELTTRIRGDDARRCELPVVLVTALASREHRECGIEVGANAYPIKSEFDQAALLECIRRVVMSNFVAPVPAVSASDPARHRSDPLANQDARMMDVLITEDSPTSREVYLAQEDRHLGLDRNGRIQLDAAPAEHGLRPAVSFLFRSLRSACGARAVGVLLSGMGRDGADELECLRDAGALTIAQDAASSVVFGMPGEAVRLGAARHVLAPEQIAALLSHLLSDLDS